MCFYVGKEMLMKNNISESEKDGLRLEGIINNLPDFCYDFFVGTATTNTVRTQITYAYNLDLFFSYIKNELCIEKIDFEYLSSISPRDIEQYLYYLKNKAGNNASALANKLSTLRSFFGYFYSRGDIDSNPALLVKTPKLRRKEITVLEPDEIVKTMDNIETGGSLSKKQQQFANKTRYRDIALFTLLLTTGIRVSECASINLGDINFDTCEIKIVRKGLKEQIIYISDEAINSLSEYITIERPVLVGNQTDVDALFISLQHQRMSVRSIERVIKKFTKNITPKHITPHKLRSTFATAIYNETGDIMTVSKLLGHESIQTTERYYAKMNKEKLRATRGIVKIKED